MSGLIDSALSALNMENKYLLAAAPAIAVGTLSIASRVVMGTMALGCKGASSVVSYIDGDISEAINDTAEELLSLTTRSFTLELQVGLGLTALTVAGIAISEFLFDKPEVTRFDKVTDFIGLTSPTYSNMEHITNFIGLTAPVTRTDQVMAAASWVGEKIGDAYEYVPSAGTVNEALIELCEIIAKVEIAIITAPFIVTKYTLLAAAVVTKFAAIVILKTAILPFRAMFLVADAVDALYQSFPTAETIGYVVTWPITATVNVISSALSTVARPFVKVFNFVTWPAVQGWYVANKIYDLVQNCIFGIIAVKNAFFSPLETLGYVSGYVYEGLIDLVDKIKSVVTFLELDDTISQIVAWPVNKIYDIGAYVFSPVIRARNLAVYIKDSFVAVPYAVLSPVETATYVVGEIGEALKAIVETIRSLSTAISKLEFS